jgi:hypothetical protein
MEVRMGGFVLLFPPYAFLAYTRIILSSSLHRKKKSNAKPDLGAKGVRKGTEATVYTAFLQEK